MALARAVLFVFVVAGLVALVGPLVSFESDVATSRALLNARVARDATIYADALARHVELLERDLRGLAGRLSPAMAEGRPPDELASLLDEFTSHHSALFGRGVLLLDPAAHLIARAPTDVGLAAHLSVQDPWFQRLLAHKRPILEVTSTDPPAFFSAMLLQHEGQAVGIVVGVLDPANSPLPERDRLEQIRLVVLDSAGDVLLPAQPPDWMRRREFHQRVEELLQSHRVEPLGAWAGDRVAAASAVGSTALRLALVGEEDALVTPLRKRFISQLVAIAAVQVAAVAVLALYLRIVGRRLLDLQRRALQQEKLAALGAASSLIAHEVRNSLNGLNAAASLLNMGAEPEVPLKSLRGQIDRLRHLATSLLQFARPEAVQQVETDLEALIAETVQGLLVLPEAPEVRVETALAKVRTRCDPMLLSTAVDNLVRNAIEAAVAAKDVGRVRAPAVKVSLTAGDGFVSIDVEDNAGGPPAGFDPSQIQPFVTSKPKGIGLGLAMARRAVEQHGGALSFARTADGSRFTIRLPRRDA